MSIESPIPPTFLPIEIELNRSVINYFLFHFLLKFSAPRFQILGPLVMVHDQILTPALPLDCAGEL